MFSKKNLTILLSAVLLCACAIGVIFTGAKAGGTEFTWYVDGVGEGDYYFATINDAIAAAKAKTDWANDAVLTIYITVSDTSATFNTASTGGNADTGRNLFNTTTVFRENNTKLPIIINGDNPVTTGTVEQNSLLLGNDPVWTLGGKKSFSATNDYTFKNLNLSSWGNSAYAFFAGSGMVTLENVNFGTTQSMIITPAVGGWTPFINWTPAQFDANKNAADNLLETGFIFKNTNYGNTNGTLSCRSVDEGISTNGQPTGGGLTIKTNMLRNKLVLGKGCTVPNVNHHSVDKINTLGFAPAESVIEVDGATVTNLYSVRGAYTGTGNKLVFNMKSGSVAIGRFGPNGDGGKFTGDLEFNWTGGSINEVWGAYKGTIDGDVTCNITGGTIKGGDKAYIGSTVTGTVTNNFKNVTITDTTESGGNVYLCGTTAGNVVNNLTGTIKVDAEFVVLGANAQTISGNVTNTISCTFENAYTKSSYLLGGSNSGVITGKVTNTIDENASFALAFHGGSRTSDVGSIENIMTGGFLETNFFGGNRQAGNVGSVKNTISGGQIKGNSYIADRGAANVTTAENIITGGIFEGNIYLGSNIGNIGTLSSTITGGTFKGNLYAGSLSGAVTNVSFTIKPEGDGLSLLSRVEGCTEFIGNGATVKIGSGTSIIAKKASGSVTFYQTKAWLAGTYFNAEEGSIEIKFTQGSGVEGKAKVVGNSLVGVTQVLYGTSFHFTDRVQLVFYFMKTAIDNSQEFVFTAKAEKNRTIASATLDSIKANVSADGKYYTLTTSPLKASEMAHTITYEGTGVEQGTLNLLDLAQRGANMAEETKDTSLEKLYKSYANYAVSVRNYAAKKESLTAWDLPYTASTATQPVLTGDSKIGVGPIAVMHEKQKAEGLSPNLMAETASITFTGRSLVLDEGIRIRYYGTGTSTAANSLSLYVNNQKIENAFTYASGTWKMDIPVSVTEGQTLLRVIVKDANKKVHFDYVERLDCLAYDLTLLGETELGSEALNYFQSAVNYQKDSRIKKTLSHTLPEGFATGYGSADATPYGVAATINGESIGVDTSEPIHVSCVAFSDGNPDNTVLLFSIPARKVPDNFIQGAIEHLATTTNVKAENIFFNATHSHSAPNITAGMAAQGIRVWYEDHLYPSVILAAQTAILDLTPSTAYIAEKDADPGTASVRRFFDSNGNFKSIQGQTLNPVVDKSKAGQYESEIDRAVRTIEFRRSGKKPILLVNWQGHAASAVGYLLLDSATAKLSSYDEDAGYISADFVYYLTSGLEDQGYLPIFCNGGSGDINCSDNLNKTNVDALKTYWGTSQIHYAVGNSLAVTAKQAASAGTKVNTGSSIYSNTIQEEVTVRKDPAARVDAARLCNASFNSPQEGNMVYAMYGFDTSLEITHMIKRNDKLGETDEIPLSVVTFGDLAFAFSSYEMFHESATQVRDGAPSEFKMTFVFGYTNGDDGYMPTTKAFKNGGYEHYSCFYVDGTAEQCVASLIKMLKK